MARQTTPQLELLKTRLEKLRPAGRGWVARCPAHDDRSASLSVAIGRNGNVLMNCFAGCTPASILQAVDLTMDDLFVNKDMKEMTPEERSEAHFAFQAAKWTAALDHLRREAAFLDILARDMLVMGIGVDLESQLRLTRAVRIIDDAYVQLSTGPGKPRQPVKKPTETDESYAEFYDRMKHKGRRQR